MRPYATARCFLDKRVIPAARKAGATAVVLLSAPEKAGELAEEALIRLRFLPYQEVVRRIAWETTWWARGRQIPLALAIFTVPALTVFAAAVAASFLFVGFFLLAGRAAAKVKAALG